MNALESIEAAAHHRPASVWREVFRGLWVKVREGSGTPGRQLSSV